MEIKFNFNSQVATSREQSERLLALGLKKETADMAHNKNTIIPKYKIVPVSDWGLLSELEEITYIPAWSLHRLIEMMGANNIQHWLGLNVERDFDLIIDTIEELIKEGYFPKEYLVC